MFDDCVAKELRQQQPERKWVRRRSNHSRASANGEMEGEAHLMEVKDKGWNVDDDSQSSEHLVFSGTSAHSLARLLNAAINIA